MKWIEHAFLGGAAVVCMVLALVLWGRHTEAVRQREQWSTAVAQKQAMLDAAQKLGESLSTQLSQEKGQQKTVYTTVLKYIPKKEIVYVNKTPVPSSGPVTVSSGYLFLWNSATAGTLEVSDPTLGASGSTADSEVTLNALLTNHTYNANVCNSNTAQLRALIAWERGIHTNP